MKKKNLPYSNRLIIENEIRVYWGESHAWNLAKNRREQGDLSCLVLPLQEPLSSFNFSIFSGKNVLVCICFNATEIEEKQLALKLLINKVKDCACIREIPEQRGRYQLIGSINTCADNRGRYHG